MKRPPLQVPIAVAVGCIAPFRLVAPVVRARSAASSRPRACVQHLGVGRRPPGSPSDGRTRAASSTRRAWASDAVGELIAAHPPAAPGPGGPPPAARPPPPPVPGGLERRVREAAGVEVQAGPQRELLEDQRSAPGAEQRRHSLHVYELARFVPVSNVGRTASGPRGPRPAAALERAAPASVGQLLALAPSRPGPAVASVAASPVHVGIGRRRGGAGTSTRFTTASASSAARPGVLE